MRRNKVQYWNYEIQAFNEIYSVNVNIYGLELTLESGYKFINDGASDHPISLMYRNNDHYNSLNLKGSVIMAKQSKKKSNLNLASISLSLKWKTLRKI